MSPTGFVILTAYKSGLVSTEMRERWGAQVNASAQSWLDTPVRGVALVTNSDLSRVATLDRDKVIGVVELEKEPKGALATAVMGLGQLRTDDGPIVISAGDTEIRPELYRHVEAFSNSRNRAGVLIFKSSDLSTEWSFAHIDSRTGQLLQVTERSQPTVFKTAGIFLFDTVQTFYESAEWCFLNQITSDGKYYTSSALNYLLSCGHDVFIGHLESTEFRKKGKKP